MAGSGADKEYARRLRLAGLTPETAQSFDGTRLEQLLDDPAYDPINAALLINLIQSTSDVQTALKALIESYGYIQSDGGGSVDLSAYATIVSVNTALMNYVTTAALSTALADYTDTDALTTLLADYVLSDDLTGNFAPLVTGLVPIANLPLDTTTNANTGVKRDANGRISAQDAVSGKQVINYGQFATLLSDNLKPLAPVKLASDIAIPVSDTSTGTTIISKAVTANKKYRFSGIIPYDVDNTANLKLQFTAPSGTVNAVVFGLITAATTPNSAGSPRLMAKDDQVQFGSGATGATSGALTGTVQALIVFGDAAIGGTGGSLLVKVGQGISKNLKGSVKAGAYLDIDECF